MDEKENEHDGDISGFFYVVAAMIFFCGTIVICVFLVLLWRYLTVRRRSYCVIYCGPFCNFCCYYRRDMKDVDKRKYDYYKDEWARIKGWKQLDYIIANWTRKVHGNNDINIANGVFNIINIFINHVTSVGDK